MGHWRVAAAAEDVVWRVEPVNPSRRAKEGKIFSGEVVTVVVLRGYIC